MQILDHYIGKYVISATFAVLLVVLGLESFMDFGGQMGSIGKSNYHLWQAFQYVLLRMPVSLYELFPIIGFLGSLIGLGRLSTQSELTVMRASGISISRITGSVIKAALLMLLVVTIVGEIFAPHWQQHAFLLRDKALHGLSSKISYGIWFHYNNSFIYIDNAPSANEVKGVILYDFDQQNHLRFAYHAQNGLFENGHWNLKNVFQTQFNTDKTTSNFYPYLPIDFVFQPQLLQEYNKSFEQQSIRELWSTIRDRQQVGLMSTDSELFFWQRIIRPVTTLILICLGVPFIFGSSRNMTMGSRVLVGVIVGFTFYILNQFFGPIALVYQWQPLIAACIPSAFFLLFYLFLIRSRLVRF